MEYNDNSYYPGADAGDEQPKPRKPRRRGMWKLLWLIPVVLLAAGLAMDSFYTLKEDQYAVLTTFGKPTLVSASGLQPSFSAISAPSGFTLLFIQSDGQTPCPTGTRALISR